ncbi:MAG TPA: sugar nucleotide-binding protein [Bdellovibrionota bacterium]|jgi:dTDP-4-dehydrorhamnose reductase
MSLGSAIVIGSGGQVAEALRHSLRERGTAVLQTSSSGRAGCVPLNLADSASIHNGFTELDSLLKGRSAEVFLAGALTHVDGCEEKQELCRKINEEGPALVAEECARRGHRLTYFSSEYVFGEAEYHGGSIGPFSETDEPAPTSFYGKCKLEAEKKVSAKLSDALIIRTTMVFSWAPGGNNFVMQVHKHLSEIAAGSTPPLFRIPVDQISTPTYAPALAEAVCQLREKGVGGIVNLVGSDCLSRKAFVEKIIESFGFEKEKSLAGFTFLKTADLKQIARRPLSAGLKVDKAKSLGVKILSLDEAFNEMEKLRS